MAMSVSSETTFFNMKLQSAVCPQLRTGYEVACEWQLPFSQLGSQNEDGIHAGDWVLS